MIGNPPWDRIKLQEVEWFAERAPEIAAQPRAADRKAMIAALQKKKAPLAADYAQASTRAEANARVLAKAGDYPLLGGGDVNLYSLFVERAQALVKPTGVVALLTPSGIAADKGASAFFRSIATTQRLGALFDFENRKVFFPDVHASFKFCTLVFGGMARQFARTRAAFFLHSVNELGSSARLLSLSADDYTALNPNTGAAPVFRSTRDFNITRGIYRRLPVLVRHATPHAISAWPVEYTRMFDMTNDSSWFRKLSEVSNEAVVPLYEGKMVQAFDHRAADVLVHSGNLHRAAQPRPLTSAEKADAQRIPVPQYRVLDTRLPGEISYALGFKDVTAPTNMRSMIAAVLPRAGYGNTLPVLLMPEQMPFEERARAISMLAANLNAFAFDYVARQKIQGQHLNWFILEQLPVVPPARFNDPLPPPFARHLREAGLMNGQHDNPTIADFVVPQVLALSYTAHDLAGFARDLGYVDAQGQVLPPIRWDDEDRRRRMAALDALFFWLYGLGADDTEYVLGTFPIVRAQDEATFGHWRTRDDILALRALLPEPEPEPEPPPAPPSPGGTGAKAAA